MQFGAFGDPMSYSLGFSQALFILTYIGNKVELGLYEYIPTQKLSQELNIPPSTAGVILRQLNRAGIIESREGANGGIRLAVDPEQLTALQIFKAIEQERPMFQVYAQINVSGDKVDRARQIQHKLFEEAEAAMKSQLERTTLRQMMDTVLG